MAVMRKMPNVIRGGQRIWNKPEVRVSLLTQEKIPLLGVVKPELFGLSDFMNELDTFFNYMIATT